MLLFVALAITLGGAFAYFSDWFEGQASVTAGTLDISGTPVFTHNGNTVSSVENFNPGDVVVADATATNSGNKSAWIRGLVDFGTLDADIAPYVRIYKGTKTAAAIEAGTEEADRITTGDEVSLGDKIIDGTGTGAETETGTDALGSNTYSQAVTIYFDKTALNVAQAKSVDFTFRFEAIQYRNNTGPQTWTGTIEQI